MKYAIEFRDGDSVFYAGLYKGGAGLAPTLATASLYDTREIAERWATNGYGRLADMAQIIEVPEG